MAGKNTADELRRLIIALLNKITDEHTLREIYLIINRIFCR